MTPDVEWERWRQMSADPVVVDQRGHMWAYADWDFGRHEPRRDAQPRC